MEEYELITLSVIAFSLLFMRRPLLNGGPPHFRHLINTSGERRQPNRASVMRMCIESLEHTLVCTPTNCSSPGRDPMVATLVWLSGLFP